MAEIKTAKKRSEIDNKYKWDLSSIFPNDEAWEKEFTYVKENMHTLISYKGTLGQSADQLAKALDAIDVYSLKMERLYVFAHMKKDEDNDVAKYQAMDDRAGSLSVEMSSLVSYVDPEILEVGQEKIMGFASEHKDLKKHDFFLSELFRLKDHVLDAKTENVLAMAGEMAGSSKTIFTMLNNVDTKFPVIEDDKGEKVEITHGRYVDMMHGSNREVRKNAFLNYYAEYEKKKNTIAATLNGSVKAELFYTRMRGYNSTLEGSLSGDNVPVSVYDNLIETVHKNLPVLHRYFDVKKKALGLDELHMYDVYAPIANDVEIKIQYNDSKDILLKGLAPLGAEYGELLKTAYQDNWMDVYENTGKTSGAYCWGAYGTHPYVLLNYQDNLESVFTIAHELGHGMHSYFSDATQPFPKAQYTIFVAEVASTVNEVLLNYYMLKTIDDKDKKINIINHFLEQFRGTVFRQVMFCEFEKIIHKSAMDGVPLTAQYLSDTYYELNKLYHGEGVVSDDMIAYEWSRIPHFYNAFYVYKYATGFSAAVALANQLLAGKPNDDYINLLKSGGSDYPIALLKKAGVDMEKSEPIQNCIDVFEDMLNQLEELLK